MLLSFSVAGFDGAGYPPPTGVPQDAQNLAPSCNDAPQLEQKAIVLFLFLVSTTVALT
jgi:hypothetical protein